MPKSRPTRPEPGAVRAGRLPILTDLPIALAVCIAILGASALAIVADGPSLLAGDAPIRIEQVLHATD